MAHLGLGPNLALVTPGVAQPDGPEKERGGVHCKKGILYSSWTSPTHTVRNFHISCVLACFKPNIRTGETLEF